MTESDIDELSDEDVKTYVRNLGRQTHCDRVCVYEAGIACVCVFTDRQTQGACRIIFADAWDGFRVYRAGKHWVFTERP